MKSMLFSLIKYFLCLFLIIGLFKQLIFIYKSIPDAVFNTDEYAWVYDSQFYIFRKEKDWSKFFVSKDSLNANWSSYEYRLIDQPQMGKYIYGYLISNDYQKIDYSEQAMWFDSNNKKFGNFGEMWIKTGGKNFDELKDVIPNKWVNIILGLRNYSFYTLILIIIVNAIFVYYLFGSKFLSLVSSYIFVLNKHFVYSSQIATMDIISIFFLYLSFIFIYYLFYKKRVINFKYIIASIIAGLFSAVSTSIKPNGIFLLIIPVIPIILNYIKTKIISMKNVKLYLYYLFAFNVVFLFLDIEVAISPQNGLFSLVSARIIQQERFLKFDNLNPFRYIFFLLNNYISGQNILSIPVISVFIVLAVKMKDNIELKRYLINKNLVLILYILIANYFYARVGFERYLLPSFLLLNIISMYGLREIFRIIKKYA